MRETKVKTCKGRETQRCSSSTLCIPYPHPPLYPLPGEVRFDVLNITPTEPGSARVKCFDQLALSGMRLTYECVNPGFLRMDATQHWDPAVMQTNHRSALGWVFSVCAPGTSS